MSILELSQSDIVAVVLFFLGGLVGWLIAFAYYRKASKDLEKAMSDLLVKIPHEVKSRNAADALISVAPSFSPLVVPALRLFARAVAAAMEPAKGPAPNDHSATKNPAAKQ